MTSFYAERQVTQYRCRCTHCKRLADGRWYDSETAALTHALAEECWETALLGEKRVLLCGRCCDLPLGELMKGVAT